MDSVEEIKQRLSVDDVLSKYLQVKPAGRNMKALCPFHHEKTPSFMVSPDKGVWHCFGCGEGGDIFEFVMKMEGLDFKGALEQLAREAGVELAQYQGDSNRKLKDRLWAANDWAVKYYHAALAKHQTALNYVTKRRGFTKQTIKDFAFGYAPASRDGLVKFLRQKGFKDEEITKAGLARTRDGRLLDLFYRRVVLPLRDGQGRTVGFTGRVLKDEAERGPKYINTPQTLLYDKSRLLFGLHVAKDAIRQRDEAVVVEGNLDVVASYQAGVKNVVAASGTALTAAQLKTLARLSRNIKLAFDDDNAGLMATERTIPIAQQEAVYLYVAKLGAKDPDDLIQQDVSQWKQAIEDADYVMDWLLHKLTSEYDASSATGKKQISDRFSASLARLSDPVEQDHYIQQLADTVSVAPGAIRRKVAALGSSGESNRDVKEAAYQSEGRAKGEDSVVEEALLAVTATYPDTRTSLQDVRSEYFSSTQRQELYRLLRSVGDVALTDGLPEELQPFENYVKILLLQGEAHYQDLPAVDRRIEAFSLVQRLHAINIKKSKTELSQKLKAAEAAGDDKLVRELLQEYQRLIKQQ